MASPCTLTKKGMDSILRRAIKLSGVRMTSGVRTRSCQAYLYKTKPGLAAPPGHSKHETGDAVDVHMSDVPKFLAWLAKNPFYEKRIYRPMSYEPWHFQLTANAAGTPPPASGGAPSSSAASGVGLGDLMEAETWARVGMVTLGTGLLGVGVWMAVGQSGKGKVSA